MTSSRSGGSAPARPRSPHPGSACLRRATRAQTRRSGSHFSPAGLGVAGLFSFAYAGPTPQLLSLSIFGFGLGASIAVASHTIMSHAPAERAGMAASVEEVSFELGGAIGITILGSLLAGIYAAILVLPQGLDLPLSAFQGIDQALRVVETLPADAARQLTKAVHRAFDTAYLTTLTLDAVLLLVVAFKGMAHGSSVAVSRSSVSISNFPAFSPRRRCTGQRINCHCTTSSR
jgi:hypothetical protein